MAIPLRGYTTDAGHRSQRSTGSRASRTATRRSGAARYMRVSISAPKTNNTPQTTYSPTRMPRHRRVVETPGGRGAWEGNPMAMWSGYNGNMRRRRFLHQVGSHGIADPR